LRVTHGGVPAEIIVADNGSTDDSARVAAEAGAIVVPLPDRRVAQVRNEAAARARGDYLRFLTLITNWIRAGPPLRCAR
jgi:glycosyltransferase involved in cell wall biosynthesis